MADEERTFPAGPTPTLGDGTPPNVDIHKLGQRDHPEEDWGEAIEGAEHGANHANRPDRTEAIRGQGKLTRDRSKEINTRGV